MQTKKAFNRERERSKMLIFYSIFHRYLKKKQREKNEMREKMLNKRKKGIPKVSEDFLKIWQK